MFDRFSGLERKNQSTGKPFFVQKVFLKKKCAVFFLIKMPQIETGIDKNSKTSNFHVFILFVSNFRWASGLELLKTLQKEEIRCPGGCFKDINAVFSRRFF